MTEPLERVLAHLVDAVRLAASGETDATREQIVRGFGDAAHEDIRSLDADMVDRLHSALLWLSGQLLESAESPDQAVLRTAEHVVRDADTDRWISDIRLGVVPWQWPPPSGMDWPQLRAWLNVYMERNVEKLGLVAHVGAFPLFDRAFATSVLFLSQWVRGDTHEKLLESYSEDDISSLVRFLGLEPD